MYCPRCGSPNTDTTKFCRQCGLAMTPVSGYVATGGTAALAPSSSKGNSPLEKVTEGLTHKQRLVMTILLWVMSPALLAIIEEALGASFLQGIIPIVAILMPLGIVWSVFRYKAKMRLLEAQQAEAQFSTPQAMPPAYQQPVLDQPPYRPPIESPGTNRLKDQVPGSVTEDETRQLPGSGK